MRNLEVASILNELADLLEIRGVEYKPTAFRKAARNIETLNKDIEKLAGEEKLREIPGVGEGIARKIKEILETETCEELEKLKKSIPLDFESLLKVEGIGPKTIKVLYSKLRIKTLKDLDKAAKKGMISRLEGFGKKSENEILKGIKFARESWKRFLLEDLYPLAKEIERQLSKRKEVTKATIAGSIRRMQETVKDIDILVVSKNPGQTMDFFTSMKDVNKIIVKGNTKSSIKLISGVNVDMRIVKNDEFGSACQYFFGNKQHNVVTRKIAIRKGYKLSEYGLFKGKKKIEGKDEKKIYKKLGLQYIEPELRENRGEIEAAREKKLPKIIPYDSIKGDLQMHSKFSDGNATIKEMAEKAKKLKYEYIAITDHAGKLAIANSLTPKRIKTYLKEIKKIRGLKVFSGCEVNIDAKGNLDLADKHLRKFDFVIASIHSGFKKDNTSRILKAMENKNVNVIGHPTGRLINKRKGYDVDLEKLFEKSKETGVILEINAHPKRLDLNDINVKSAIENKCKLIISTDAHSISNMDFMKFGIATARRGWAEKRDIVNTFSLSKFEKFFGL